MEKKHFPEEIKSEPSILPLNWGDQIQTFKELDLKDTLLKGLYSQGIRKPTQLQKQCMVPILTHCHTLIQACSCTGASTSFAIAALNMINTEVNEVQVLLLYSLRECVMNTARIIRSFAEFMPEVRILELIGGSSILESVQKLNQTPHIVIGTPDRVQHLINSGHLQLDIVWD